MGSFIDFHMHSSASDGKDSPGVLFEKIKTLGVTHFSLTDHDTIDGAREMENLVKKDASGIAFVRGIEFSCITSLGKCHLLGYRYDWDNEAFRDILSKGAGLRKGKLEQRLTFLRDQYNIVFPKEDVDKMRQMGSVGKPHMAEIMVRMGIADTISEAITKYIDNCLTSDSRIPADEVIGAIRESGGISVWAHPFGGVGEPRIERSVFQEQLKYLKTVGLQGLECFYSRYSSDEIEELKVAAEKNNLFISGGSDYHGRKKYPPIGTLNMEKKEVEMVELSICKDLFG